MARAGAPVDRRTSRRRPREPRTVERVHGAGLGIGPALVLAPGREKSLRLRHPWIFSGAIDRIEGEPAPGDTVMVVAADGAFLARAAFSPSSQIRARVWSFDQREIVDEAFITRRVARAVAARAPLFDAARPNSELDRQFLSGLREAVLRGDAGRVTATLLPVTTTE